MPVDVADWLSGLGLGYYAPAFAANDIDGEVLRELTADDLIGLGVTSIGHRRKLLAAIAALRGEAPQHPSLTAVPIGSPLPSPPPPPGGGRGGAGGGRRPLAGVVVRLGGRAAAVGRRDPEGGLRALGGL